MLPAEFQGEGEGATPLRRRSVAFQAVSPCLPACTVSSDLGPGVPEKLQDPTSTTGLIFFFFLFFSFITLLDNQQLVLIHMHCL